MKLRFWFLTIASVISLSAKPLDVTVSAPSAILMNAKTGAILFEKEAHVRSYPASTTKIGTALFALDHKKVLVDQKVTVSAEALRMKSSKQSEALPYLLEKEGTMMWVMRGEILSYDALLHGLMLVSGNDAANAIAEAISGTVPKFVEELNDYLQEIGCVHTQFRNPHGLHDSEHYTTAYDLCLMLRKAIQIPKFRQIVSTVSYNCPKTNKQPEREIRMTNPLIKPGKLYYPKAIGGKTGFTSKAMNALAFAAEQEGRTLVAVVLGCENRIDRYKDAIRLFETAFAEKKEKRHLFGKENLFERAIPGAKSALKGAIEGELALEFYPSEEPVCKAFVHWDDTSLPIRKGERVGELRILDSSGALLQVQELRALDEVKGTFWFNIKKIITPLFK
ncbi:MAG: D-alanyl-D-alanine carboxypeptidase family protein [Chlamydiota bacterium]